ncbi:MAG: glycosyltransferase family 2 protein [Limisphaerales bacterium]
MKYVLVTPARNEEAFIEGTIRSVLAQTVRPVKWIIVSDGSTDRTDQIVKDYARQHHWIELLRMPERRDRQFAAKAHAFNAGYDRIRASRIDYQVIGNLDADITFDTDYFCFLLSKFSLEAALGVVGTPFIENAAELNTHTYAHRFAQLEHVSGACQMFRRECFDQIGGYAPIKGGAIDWIAVTTARMKGWKTRTFPEKVCLHHRKLGTGTHGPLATRFHYGRKAYYVGGHPLWELLRGVFQMRERPFLLGGLCFQAGYLWSAITRVERPVAPELVAFHRSEQMARLRRLFLPRSPEAKSPVASVLPQPPEVPPPQYQAPWLHGVPRSNCVGPPTVKESLPNTGAERISNMLALAEESGPAGGQAEGPLQSLAYVLITAARNEEKYIENTMRSVVSQTVPPLKWIIVSDGSTDRTDELARQYATRYDWIELLRMPERSERHFAAKALCVNSAYERLKPLRFAIIGNLDADVSFEPDFMESLLRQFASEPNLGVAGTPYIEPDFKPGQHSMNSAGGDWNYVSGPCQLFRRACFEEVGGYVAIKTGAIDWVAVTTARMKGWQTRTFSGKTYFHRRKMGRAESTVLGSSFDYGRKAYVVGGHPLWELLKGFYRMHERPFLLQGLAFQAGYLTALVKRMKTPVPPELRAFHRREQMARLRRLFRSRSSRANTPVRN